jgi:hypothetical protein
MATATTTTTIEDNPTTVTTTPPTSHIDTTALDDGTQQIRSGLRSLGRIGRAIVEAGSIPSHPFLAQAIGPNGVLLWTTTTNLHPPKPTTPSR